MNTKIYNKLVKRCLELAIQGKDNVEPNPYVGAVIYDENTDKIISEGYHEKYGMAHAEVNAIKNLKTSAKDKIIAVNLEPCSHYGKTPPCADLIIKSGFKKVVVGMVDPNPIVKNNGIKKLKNAGVEVVSGILEDKCRKLNKVFVKNMETKKPYVMLKTATTLDSKIATINNQSKWITGEKARKEVQKMRSDYQAIMTGSGTILADNPYMNVRIKDKKSPIRIIFNPSNTIPFDKKNFNILANDGVKIILVNNSKINVSREITQIGFKDFNTLFSDLYELNITSVMVEAGNRLNSLLVKANEIDEINQFIAPKIFGGGLDFVKDLNIQNIEECVKLKDITTRKIGDDILINGIVAK